MQVSFNRQPYNAGIMSDSPSRATKFRALREASGLSQREFAKHLGVHHSNVSYWERSGNLPGAEVLPQMAHILGVEVGQLLTDTPKPRGKPTPVGRARLAFDAVSRLPKRQQ